MDSKELKAWLRDNYPSYLRAPEGNGHISKPRTRVSCETTCSQEECTSCKRAVQVNGDVATRNCKQSTSSSLVTVVIDKSLTAAGASLATIPSPADPKGTTL